MSEYPIKSLEYLRDLSLLVDDDPACECCSWAAEEIERLREQRCLAEEEVIKLREELRQERMRQIEEQEL